jgi:hypothetical protein
MFRNIPDKFIRASNLILFVTLLKLLNAIILDHRIPLIIGGILLLFLVSAFLVRKGFKWMIYLMPLIMIFPWVLLQTNIIHVFKINPLAAILTGLQFFLQVLIMEVLLTSSKSTEEGVGNSKKAIRV